MAKAVTDLSPWVNRVSLSTYANTPQQKAAAYLKAYKVGWFYKAGKKIADDVSTLDWSLSSGDAEEGEDETVLDRPELATPFESLSPIDQFQRLLERPNPSYTGRALFRKTQVRLDFAGAACWYLENGSFGLPAAIYGISPARMWPSYDKGGNLIGWVMDKEAPTGGVPFDKSEILWFPTGNAEDDDIWGQSVVEAVYAQVPLTDAMARHTADVLTTGGRLAGMLSPKDRALSEDEFMDAQRAWRNVASDPNAARRLLIFPEPMEYSSGASTPAEIGIPELAVLNRDEILTAFPVSPYQLGVPTPGGLNSGEVRREDRRDYWEGTIHPRADLIEEFIQVSLLSRYEEAMGQTYDFEIAEPNLDDASTLTLKATAFKDLVGIGLDPEESIKAVGLGHIKWTGLPAILDPVQQQMMAEQRVEAMAQEPEERNGPPMKVARAIEERERITKGLEATVHREVAKFFRDQRERVERDIAASYPAAKSERKAWIKADPEWWDSKREDDLLRETMRSLYVQIGRAGLQLAADDLDVILYKRSVDPIVSDLLAFGGSRIKGINDRTLQALTIELAEGSRRGYSITQLIEGVPDEGYRGVQGVTLENGTPVFGDLRAETIARTETRTSFNRSAILGYKELGVEEFVAYDGDEDEECRERNGQTFSAEEALEEDEREHPNGTLTMSPVVEKSFHKSQPPATIVQNFISHDGAMKTFEQAAPIVNVANDFTPVTDAIEALVKSIPAPVVNLPPPIVNVKAPGPSEVVVTSMPDRAHRLVRDKQGKPTGTVETDA